MTSTTSADTTPNTPHRNAHPSTWLETAITILRATRHPMTAAQIVAAAHATGTAPPSQTRTPTQSVNRDLNAAAARHDRVAAGPQPGQFYADPTLGTHHTPSTKAPRLPTPPLALLITTRGGLRACWP